MYGILRLDGRVQGLHRLERALLEPRVRGHEVLRALAELVRLAAEHRRRAPDEQAQHRPQQDEDDEGCQPDEALLRRDRVLDPRRVRVDLERSDHVAAVDDRRVDLERAAGPLRLRGVLGPVELLQLGLGLARLDDLGQVLRDRELLARALGLDARPGEGPVGPPDLDAQDVGPGLEARLDDALRLVADGDLAAVDDLPVEDAVRVLGEADLGVVERLLPDCAGHERREHECRRGEQDGAREHEHAQERERARDLLRDVWGRHLAAGLLYPSICALHRAAFTQMGYRLPPVRGA